MPIDPSANCVILACRLPIRSEMLVSAACVTVPRPTPLASDPCTAWKACRLPRMPWATENVDASSAASATR